MKTYSFNGLRRTSLRLGRGLRAAVAVCLLRTLMHNLRKNGGDAVVATAADAVQFIERQQHLGLADMVERCSEPARSGFSRAPARWTTILNHVANQVALCAAALEEENASASVIVHKIRERLTEPEWNPYHTTALWKEVIVAVRCKAEELARIGNATKAEFNQRKDEVEREGASAEKNTALIAAPAAAPMNRRSAALIGFLVGAAGGLMIALAAQFALLTSLALILIFGGTGTAAGLVMIQQKQDTVVDARFEHVWKGTRQAAIAYAQALGRHQWHAKRAEFWRLVHDALLSELQNLPERIAAEKLIAAERKLEMWWEGVPAGFFVSIAGSTEIHGRGIAFLLASRIAANPLLEILRSVCATADDPDVDALIANAAGIICRFGLHEVVNELNHSGQGAALTEELKTLYGYCASVISTKPGEDIDKRLTPEVTYLGLAGGRSNPVADVLAPHFTKPAFYSTIDSDAVEVLCMKQNVTFEQLGLLQRYVVAYNHTSAMEREKIFRCPGITIDSGPQSKRNNSVPPILQITSTLQIPAATIEREIAFVSNAGCSEQNVGR